MTPYKKSHNINPLHSRLWDYLLKTWATHHWENYHKTQFITTLEVIPAKLCIILNCQMLFCFVLCLKSYAGKRQGNNYRVCPQEVWRCGGKAEWKRSEKKGAHRSTSEGFVDPRYYQLSELTGYTYFTKQSTCHVLTAFGFTYEPKFLHETPWVPCCFASFRWSLKPQQKMNAEC